jgi:hypothetical protein
LGECNATFECQNRYRLKSHKGAQLDQIVRRLPKVSRGGPHRFGSEFALGLAV